jgi:putative sterol carrier protein
MSVTDDVKEIFEKMPAAFRPEKAANTNAVIQLELTGEGGGNWVIRINNGHLALEEGTVTTPDLTLGMAASDYVAITRGELNPVNAFMAKKITLQGNMTLAMKFPDMFDRDTT